MPVYETVKDHYLEQEIIFNLYRNKSRNLHKSKFLSLNLQWKNGNPSEYKSRIGAIFQQKWSFYPENLIKFPIEFENFDPKSAKMGNLEHKS